MVIRRAEIDDVAVPCKFGKERVNAVTRKFVCDGADGDAAHRVDAAVFLRKWRLQMAMLMMGETAVASAAPAKPSPKGNMKI